MEVNSPEGIGSSLSYQIVNLRQSVGAQSAGLDHDCFKHLGQSVAKELLNRLSRLFTEVVADYPKTPLFRDVLVPVDESHLLLDTFEELVCCLNLLTLKRL